LGEKAISRWQGAGLGAETIVKGPLPHEGAELLDPAAMSAR
jgi:hypothetical protein